MKPQRKTDAGGKSKVRPITKSVDPEGAGQFAQPKAVAAGGRGGD